jgi:micrococcal nuclease
MTHAQKKRLLGIVFGLLIFGAATLAQRYGWLGEAAPAVEQANPGLYAVSHFTDGDTISVSMNGKNESVRMIGVDTPETHKPNTPVQCYGPAASAFTKNLIGSQKVRLEADPTNQNRDRYGRLLRYIYLPDGRLVEAELIKNGYGFAYTSFPFTKKDDFVKLEDAARAANKGLWANCTVTETNGRKQTNNAE